MPESTRSAISLSETETRIASNRLRCWAQAPESLDGILLRLTGDPTGHRPERRVDLIMPDSTRFYSSPEVRLNPCCCEYISNSKHIVQLVTDSINMGEGGYQQINKTVNACAFND